LLPQNYLSVCSLNAEISFSITAFAARLVFCGRDHKKKHVAAVAPAAYRKLLFQ
jgi:hypothetical protein